MRLLDSAHVRGHFILHITIRQAHHSGIVCNTSPTDFAVHSRRTPLALPQADLGNLTASKVSTSCVAYKCVTTLLLILSTFPAHPLRQKLALRYAARCVAPAAHRQTGSQTPAVHSGAAAPAVQRR